MPNSPPALLACVPPSMIGASSASIDIDANDDFVISSCNQLFIDMIGLVKKVSFPVAINSILSDIDAGEFLYYLHLANQNMNALEFELSFTNNQCKQWWLIVITPLVEQTKPQNRLLITGININERKQLQEELDVSRNRYRSVIQSVHDCIVTTDEQSNIVLFNKAAELTWGYSLKEVVGQKLTMLLPNKYRQHHQRFVDDFSTSITQSRQMSSRSIVYGQKKNGCIFPAEISISKIMVSGKLEFTAIVRDISERSRLLEELQHQAMTDGLTGLKNRLFLDKELKRETEQITNTLSLLLIDLDHFKLVNDGHGHAIGDKVLIGFAKTVSNLLKPHHTFARYGGEEFIVLLPDTNQQQAIEIADELCLACAHKVHVNDIKSTVSIGVSVFESGIDDADSLIQRADIALYQAKSSGRNCAKFKSCDKEASKAHRTFS